ncbi:MAG: hypothetical protein RL380_386 [Verrucomicrobiota bacterium]
MKIFNHETHERKIKLISVRAFVCFVYFVVNPFPNQP